MKKKIIIGSRGSKLALIYAKKVKEALLNFSENIDEQNIEIKSISTKGDTILDKRLSDLGGKGLFSKNIEEELFNKKIDIAVHALKDMPAIETQGLRTACFLKRNDPREILISLKDKKLDELKKNSVVGTSSFRREFQLKRIRNDLNCELIRGNVDTRISKLKKGKYDAIILSSAGINSLDLNNEITQFFTTSEMIPSAGQGIIALQCRKEDNQIIELIEKVNHKPTFYRALAERGVLKILEGDCETAIGVHAEIKEDEIELNAELFSIDGTERFHEKISGKIEFAENLGEKVGKILKEKSNNSYKK
jgi:hydroxymethylbilane synthase